MFINAKQVKQFLHEKDKQISKEAIEALNYKVQAILLSAVGNCRGFKRVGATEINFTK